MSLFKVIPNQFRLGWNKLCNAHTQPLLFLQFRFQHCETLKHILMQYRYCGFNYNYLRDKWHYPYLSTLHYMSEMGLWDRNFLINHFVLYQIKMSVSDIFILNTTAWHEFYWQNRREWTLVLSTPIVPPFIFMESLYF